MIRFLAAAAVGLGVSFAMNRLVRPVGDRARRPIALVIQASLYLVLAALLALLLRRPVFACALVLCGQLAMVLINDAKYRALREPLLFTDLFEMSGHVLRYPRLYLPFLGLGKAIAGAAGLAGALYLGLVLEPAATGRAYFAAMTLICAGAALALAIATVRASARSTTNIGADFERLGLVASCWVHWMTELWARPRLPERWPLADVKLVEEPRTAAGRLPHVVAVQSESFFDARRLHPDVRADVLGAFDAACASAACHGRLAVPSWGANTVRAEFAFLAGLPVESLGLDGFNPYRRAARRSPPTLASVLKGAGYRTVCVHPFPGGFYGRRRVLPQLGFDRFVDIGGFRDAERCGPFVSDAAVARTVLELLAESEVPLFVFAITMENHGPLHLERPRPGEAEALYERAPGPGYDDLTVYLRHLRNADGMIAALAQAPAAERDRVLCFFGDHVPIMPGVYARLGFDDPRTDYVIWSSRQSGAPRREDLGVESLALRLLEAAGAAAAR